jgi:hypothetical protein
MGCYWLFIYIIQGVFMKRICVFLAMLAVLLAFGLTLTSCSTVPAAKFVPNRIEIDEILGPIEGHFLSYQDAFEAAKKTYPRAQAVVFLKSTGGNNIIPIGVKHGYYAVTIKLVPWKKERATWS